MSGQPKWVAKGLDRLGLPADTQVEWDSSIAAAIQDLNEATTDHLYELWEADVAYEAGEIDELSRARAREESLGKFEALMASARALSREKE